MVYYQSTQLVIKTEKSNQAPFCNPPQTTATIISNTTTNIEAQQLQQGTPLPYSNNNTTVTIMPQQPASTSLPHTSIIPISVSPMTASSLPANIKAEPNIGVFGTVTPTTTENTTTSTLALNIANAGTSGTMTISRKPIVNKPKFKCEQCGMTFGSKSAHTSHTKSHARSSDLVAGTTAGSTIQAETKEPGTPAGIPKTPNMTGVAGGVPYQCNVCLKTFAVPARLIRHYRTHTGERPFKCEFCHKLFSVKENLQVHRRIHTKERPYKCDVCARAFEHSGKLHRHMRIHTGERPHKCSVCEKTFIQSGQLVIHMRTHTGEKPYKCPVEGCGKGFTCSKQLKVHSRTHTGEKPYHCDICYRDFGYNHVLKLHRVQHYGAKCYKCTICDMTFKNKKDMEAHIKGHAKELPDNEDGVSAVAVAVSCADQSNNSASSSSSGELSSAPASPSSTSAAASVLAPVKSRKTKRSRVKKSTSNMPQQALASSPRSSLSPSSSLASTSHLSAGTPESMPTSPQTPNALEIDQHSRDSGVASGSNNRQLPLPLATMTSTDNNAQNTFTYIIEELPTDLSKQHTQPELPQTASTKFYQNNQIQNPLNYHQQTAPPSYNYQYILQQQRVDFAQSEHEPPTINPALLEAASIVRRRDMLDSPREEEVTYSAIPFKQTRHTEQQNQYQQQQQHKNHDYQYREQMHEPVYDIERSTLMAAPMPTTSSFGSQHLSLGHDLSQYDDTEEANELIEHYKRGELARHGLHKGYAPVPKYEPSLLNNEIVRQVEAAIAPLRSSTESPERSSSPESDSMMMADRDVMTLPLRKRKLYMHEGSPMEATEQTLSQIGLATSSDETNHVVIDAVTNANHEAGGKVMRMSSVIQFAKAS